LLKILQTVQAFMLVVARHPNHDEM